MKKIITLFLLIGITITSFSQNNIEALKRAHITKELDLTTSEAEKFWPIYNQFVKTERQLKSNPIKKLRLRIRDVGGIDNLSEKEASEILNSIATNEEKLFFAKKQFLKDLKTVLSSKKIIKLHKAERDFNRRILKQLQNRRKNNRRH
jgi:hypothetical protein